MELMSRPGFRCGGEPAAGGGLRARFLPAGPETAGGGRSAGPDPLVAAASVEHAFQPIIGTQSLRVHGFEALARLPEDAGFANAHELLDAAWAAGCLRQAERELISRAVSRFAGVNGAASTRLFCNVDNRVFDDEDVSAKALVALAQGYGLTPANICIELTERQPPESVEALARIVDLFLKHNLRIAIDDFGQGFSGLHMLLKVEPHYVKIDRLFIDGLGHSPRKQAIVGKVTGLAHSLGFMVVAEGVEQESDFRAARELGCDLAQGYLIARPTVVRRDLRLAYDAVGTVGIRDDGVPQRLAELMEPVPPIPLDEPLPNVLEIFKAKPRSRLVPVVDAHGHVHGAIYEEDIRRYLYSDFGVALLGNRGLSPRAASLTRRCPVSGASARIDAIVESYVVADSTDGMLLTLDGRYAGYLSNHAVLQLAAERDIAVARDQNPLTRLPGNAGIAAHLEALLRSADDRTVVFFDFDNFKAFNDVYGFAAGDLALRMFAELLETEKRAGGAFVGHVGGDDFLLSTASDGEAIARRVASRFGAEVAQLYTAEDRGRGGIHTQDRYGDTRFFPLLRASAAVVDLPASRAHLTPNDVTNALAVAKAAAKRSPQGVARAELPPTPVHAAMARLSG